MCRRQGNSSLNLESDNPGRSGAAAGVGLESEAGQSQLSEKRQCKKTKICDIITSYNFPDNCL